MARAGNTLPKGVMVAEKRLELLGAQMAGAKCPCVKHRHWRWVAGVHMKIPAGTQLRRRNLLEIPERY